MRSLGFVVMVMVALAGAPRAEADRGAALMRRAERSRGTRAGRVILGPVMGIVLGGGAAVGAAVGFNAACGSGPSLPVRAGGECLLGLAITQLTLYTLLVPAGVSAMGGWLGGEGSYGGAFLGSVSAVGLSFGIANATDSSFAMGMKLSAALVPLVSTVFYEVGAVGAERRLEASARGAAVSPMVFSGAAGEGSSVGLGIIVSGW